MTSGLHFAEMVNPKPTRVMNYPEQKTLRSLAEKNFEGGHYDL